MYHEVVIMTISAVVSIFTTYIIHFETGGTGFLYVGSGKFQ